MDFDQSYYYLAANGQAIKVGDEEDSYNTGLNQFLEDKSYKPTFGPFALKGAVKKTAKKTAKKAAKKSVAKKAAKKTANKKTVKKAAAKKK